jgi:DNA-binding NtrC family response regulator
VEVASPKPRILLVHTQPALRSSVLQVLADEFDVMDAGAYADGLALIYRHRDLHAIVADHRLGNGLGGPELLLEARRRVPRAARILIAADPRDARAEIENHAIDLVLLEPWDPEELRLVLAIPPRHG